MMTNRNKYTMPKSNVPEKRREDTRIIPVEGRFATVERMRWTNEE